MVRRSTVDRSPQSAVHGMGYEAGADHDDPRSSARGRASRGWGGAGGRWLVWTFRVILWAVVLIVGYRGVTAIVLGETQHPAPAGGVSAGPASSFPVTLADAYALQFGAVYLNFSQNTAGQRASQLASFLPPGADSQLGWNGTGSLQLQSEQVAGTDVRDASHAVVTLLAKVNGQLMELGVPIYATRAGLVVSGEPAWLPAPSKASVPSTTVGATDSATQSKLMNQLQPFFQAYASGNQATLARFLAPGASVGGLGGDVAFKSLVNISVPPGGTTRHITATVLWTVPAQSTATGKGSGVPAGLEMSYAMTIVQRGGSWYVGDISASTTSQGPP
jgi:Conjugative transposon protein TcpC